MGCSDLMPGISGGTIALILGVYKKLIHSINAISIKNFKTLTVDVFSAAEFCSFKRRLAHLLTFYGFLLYVISKCFLFLINIRQH
mgnify:CR=1 FL=1